MEIRNPQLSESHASAYDSDSDQSTPPAARVANPSELKQNNYVEGEFKNGQTQALVRNANVILTEVYTDVG